MPQTNQYSRQLRSIAERFGQHAASKLGDGECGFGVAASFDGSRIEVPVHMLPLARRAGQVLCRLIGAAPLPAECRRGIKAASLEVADPAQRWARVLFDLAEYGEAPFWSNLDGKGTSYVADFAETSKDICALLAQRGELTTDDLVRNMLAALTSTEQDRANLMGELHRLANGADPIHIARGLRIAGEPGASAVKREAPSAIGPTLLEEAEVVLRKLGSQPLTAFSRSSLKDALAEANKPRADATIGRIVSLLRDLGLASSPAPRGGKRRANGCQITEAGLQWLRDNDRKASEVERGATR